MSNKKVSKRELLPLLGKVKDAELARKFGVSRERIRQYRTKYNVEKCPKQHREWSKEEIQLLGTVTDREVSEICHIAISEVSRKRNELGIKPFCLFSWDKKSIALLGTMSDAELAKKLNTKTNTVYYKRTTLNIPSYRSTKIIEDKVHTLALCEQNFLILKPNILYRFEVRENCEECKKLSGVY
jgi:hypothetical protein